MQAKSIRHKITTELDVQNHLHISEISEEKLLTLTNYYSSS